MKSILSLTSTLFFCAQLQAQVNFSNKEDVYRIVYSVTNNGKTRPDQNKTVVPANALQSLVSTENDLANKSKYPFEYFTVDAKNNVQFLYAVLGANKSISTVDSTAIGKQKMEFLPDTKKILGFTCKKAKTIVNSNTIELWYTNDVEVKGAPSILGADLGLVLEMIRNGNTTTTAIGIKKLKTVLPASMQSMQSQNMDLLSYKDEIWKSRFSTIPVFSHQRINFADTATVAPGIMRFANGTIVLKKISIPAFSSSKNVFLDVKEQSAGDAYDRTGTVFLIANDKPQSFLDGLQNGASTLPVYENGNGKKYQGVVATSQYSPAFELMRFFTPFGVKQFNYLQLKDKPWQNAVYYRQDITDFAPLLNGKDVYVGVFIGNYDRGGHLVDVNITLHDGFEQNQKNQKIISLFNTLNIMEMAGQDYATMFDCEKGLLVNFDLKEPLKNGMLRYTTTGHGGWGGGDEFVPKENTILLNDKVVFKMTPWREDCGSYRLYNPASGNFNTGLSSSDLSRSNWCPGTVTNPYFISLGDLPAGQYTLQVKIPQGKPEGSSFSSWNVSGVLVGE